MNDKLIDFCERLPPQACVFVCRIGTGQQLQVFFKGITTQAHEQGYKPSDKDTVQTMVYETLHDLVEDCLLSAEDEGWGMEHDTIRFLAYTIDRKPVRSKVLKKALDITQEETQTNSIQALTHAIIRMSEEVRRTLRTQEEYSEKQLGIIEKLTQRNIDQAHEKLEIERDNMIRSILMEIHDKDNESDVESRGYNLLERAISLYQQSQTMNIKDKIKETIMTDDETLDEFLQDEEVVKKIYDRMMNRGE